MGELHEVKLAARGARLRLNNETCRIKIEKAGLTNIFETAAGIFQHEGEDCVRVPNEQIIVPLKDITELEMPISRFTPDKMCWMKIAWED